MDVGIHLVDLTCHVLGDIAEANGIATNEVWKLPGTEDNGFAILRSSAGVVATLQASWTEWKGYRFYLEAYGDRGMVRAYYAPVMNVLIKVNSVGQRIRRRIIPYPLDMLKEKLFGWQETVIETFQMELADFVSLCYGGRPATIARGSDGLRAVEIADAVRRNAAQNS